MPLIAGLPVRDVEPVLGLGHVPSAVGGPAPSCSPRQAVGIVRITQQMKVQRRIARSESTVPDGQLAGADTVGRLQNSDGLENLRSGEIPVNALPRESCNAVSAGKVECDAGWRSFDALLAFKFLAEETALRGDTLPWSVLSEQFEFEGQRVPLIGPQGRRANAATAAGTSSSSTRSSMRPECWR
jgi:hypothetical protein